MGLLDKFKSSENGKKYSIGSANENIFSVDKSYSLVEVITLLKYQAFLKWGSDEALEILLVIASIRECLLNDAKLNKFMKTADKESLMKEIRNVDVKIGKVLRNFELLCEEYSLLNPLRDLEGTEALLEMKKLVKLDEDFYGNENALVITEDLYRTKSKELGAKFMYNDEVYPLANIQIYDTMILLILEVVQYDFKEISSQIKDCVLKLRKLVADRKSLDLKIKNNKNVCSLEEVDMIGDLSLQMGEIKAFFDGVADEARIPNKLYYEVSSRDFWEKLACMFEVLNSVSTVPVKDTKKTKSLSIPEVKEDKAKTASDKEKEEK